MCRVGNRRIAVGVGLQSRSRDLAVSRLQVSVASVAVAAVAAVLALVNLEVLSCDGGLQYFVESRVGRRYPLTPPSDF